MKCSAADAAKGKNRDQRRDCQRTYAIAGEDAVQTAEPMKNHTTFRVGGPADYFVAPHTEEEIRKIVALCEEKEIPWFVTGNGSNLVVSDEGYHGVILSVYKNFQGIEVEGNRIRRKPEACSYPSAGRQEKPVFPVWSLPPESLEL